MNPKWITVHCSASRKGRYLTAQELRKFHTEPEPVGRGWSDIGYHIVIRTDGIVEEGRPMNRNGAHVRGHNRDNIGICLIGGLDIHGKPADTYNEKQYHALFATIVKLCEEHGIPFENVKGHRDWSPDLNKDGVITSDEFIKDCPCFDVQAWFKRQLSIYELIGGDYAGG